MKLRTLIAAIVITLPSLASADQTIAYPTKDEMLFSIVAPDDWKLDPADSKEDYFAVTGPSGAALYFRAMPGKIEDSIKEIVEYLDDTYTDIKISEAKEAKLNGLDMFFATGTATEGETEYTFELAWVAFPNGDIGEIWYEAEKGDTEGAEVAAKILKSFAGKAEN